MKHYLLLILQLASLVSLAQEKVGFELGGNLLRNLDSISYTNKRNYFGGEVGVNFEFPVVNTKLSVETGIHFYDTYYKFKGPSTYLLTIDENNKAYVFLLSRMNDFGISLPVRGIINLGKICPFVGIELFGSLSKNREEQVNLYSEYTNSGTLFAYGQDIIKISPFQLNLCGGIYYQYSPAVKYRLQYSYGVNSFVTHTFTERIINGVIIDKPYIESTRMQQMQLAMVLTPNWHKNKPNGKTLHETKAPLKERFKALYK